MSDVTIECPYCGDSTPIPDDMRRYDWKNDCYSVATSKWHCWNCGEEMHVKVHRQIMKAEVVK